MAFRTIGCKLNQCDTAQMQEALVAAGFRVVGWDQPADVRVINTCTVTAKSDRTCRREIRLAKRLDPDSVVVVTGCYAQVNPDAVTTIPEVNLVLGNVDKPRLAQHLDRFMRRAPASATEAGVKPGNGSRPSGGVFTAVSAYPDRPSFDGEFISQYHGHTRAFLKIQTGCNSRCSYCIIPLARGPARSMPRVEVIEQVRLLAQRGFREVVLTGINLGSWGRDTGEGSLAELLRDLAAIDGPLRFRLSSIEPLEVVPELLSATEDAGDRMAHHFHLPLQSASDAVLRNMNRPYTSADYLTIIGDVARRFPDAALGADVIVGFPGETDRDFADTVTFVERAPLTYIHVFTYSDRPGTAASAMKAKVHPETIHERSVHLRALGEHKRTAFLERMTRTEQRALILRERSHDGRLVALTGNYMEALVAGDDSLMNRFAHVQLERQGADGRWEATLLGVEGAT